MPKTADDVIDAARHLVLPGLVNTHHHLYQTLTRAILGLRTPGCLTGCAPCI
jgi:cytosine/adenosine deaminase-related metal-dependent hydrolase